VTQRKRRCAATARRCTIPPSFNLSVDHLRQFKTGVAPPCASVPSTVRLSLLRQSAFGSPRSGQIVWPVADPVRGVVVESYPTGGQSPHSPSAVVEGCARLGIGVHPVQFTATEACSRRGCGGRCCGRGCRRARVSCRRRGRWWCSDASCDGLARN